MAKVVKKRKIKYKNVFLFILFIILMVVGLFTIASLPITNIYIEGNSFLSDQEIIDEAGLRNYPKIYEVSSRHIQKKLEKNVYVTYADVKRSHFFRQITITVSENIPLVYYAYNDVTLLKDATEVKDKYDLPTLINQVPEDILKELLEELSLLDNDVLIRISELQYEPTVDPKLFHLVMTDGNDVYVNFKNFTKLNDYIDMVQKFDKNKGTLHLDIGNYLEKY